MTESTCTLESELDASEDVDNRQFTALGSTIVDEYELRIPPAYRGLYRRAITGRSRKSAVRAFCLECVGWSPKEVRLCVTKGCPLYMYRVKG